MKNRYIDQADLLAAASWWNSLPGGKKRYLKEHSKLTNDDKTVRYWLANVKQVDFAASTQHAIKSLKKEA